MKALGIWVLTAIGAWVMFVISSLIVGTVAWLAIFALTGIVEGFSGQ